MTHAPGWYRDGTGRHAQRYFDGVAWTEHVADASGRQGRDPLASAATAPHAAATTGWSASAGRAWQAAAAPPTVTGTGTGTAAPATSFAAVSMPSTLTTPRPAAARAPGGLTLTVGAAVSAAGTLLAALSIVGLDYWEAGPLGVTLGDIADAPAAADISVVASSYAGVGRWLALLAVVAALVAVLRLPALARLGERAVAVSAGVVGAFALWHLVGLFVGPSRVGMAVTGLLGAVGLAAVAAAPLLRRPLGRVGR